MSYDLSSEEEIAHALSERTLAIIKPEAYENAEQIENTILANGFIILAKRHLRLTPEQAADLYQGHYGKQHFPHLVAHMSSGPIIALVIAKNDGLEYWKQLMGPARVAEAQAYWPDSVRACYGRRTKYGDYFNAVHGSASTAEAIREIHFFFPHMLVGPLLRKWQVEDYMQTHIHPTLLTALTELTKVKPVEPIIWLAEYLLQHNPNKPQYSGEAQEAIEMSRCETPPPSEVTDN